MIAFYDACCPGCGRKIGWLGELKDRPACRCGRRPDQAELEAADRKMDEMKELLLARPTAEVCRRQRIVAGLSLGQAAKLLGLTRLRLADYENGRAEIP